MFIKCSTCKHQGEIANSLSVIFINWLHNLRPQHIHHALRCRIECIYARSLTNGNAQTAKHAASVERWKITKCFTASNAIEAFIFTVWAYEMFPKVRYSEHGCHSWDDWLVLLCRSIPLRQLQHLHRVRHQVTWRPFQCGAFPAAATGSCDDSPMEPRVHHQPSDQHPRTYSESLPAVLPKSQWEAESWIEFENYGLEMMQNRSCIIMRKWAWLQTQTRNWIDINESDERNRFVLS